MCGPSRGNILTGRYAHRTGIVANDIRPYRQANTISPKLRSAGYKTIFIGKHINKLRKRYPTKAAMAELASGWSRMDAIWENGGLYYDWRQYRKGSMVKKYGQGEKSHSTYQAVQRAVAHIKSTPRTAH
jgi:arylsulfatase A-like enzyme